MTDDNQFANEFTGEDEHDDYIHGPCSHCGGDHWRPDCPEIAEFVKQEQQKKQQHTKEPPSL